ncbi:HD domain-containing protein [Candidatus Parcubacteria bacterium]|nr:HD domain-containing protein [Candidatus Parcubacteria bacterium]
MKNTLEQHNLQPQTVSQQVDENNNKIEKIKPKLEQFKKKLNIFNEEDKKKIEEALNLMLEIHINQEDRSDGTHYIEHPLEIADDVIGEFNIRDRDLIITALLHDSVEDQSLILSHKYLAKYFPKDQWDELLGDNIDIEKKYSTELREISLLLIHENFGTKVKNTVNSLSNPDFTALVEDLRLKGNEKTKYDLYKEHVNSAIIDPDVCVVKYADFTRNALAIDNLDEGERKNHLRKKYGPVIKDVFLPLFKKMNETHPLYSKKGEIIKKLEEYYEKYYQ